MQLPEYIKFKELTMSLAQNFFIVSANIVQQTLDSSNNTNYIWDIKDTIGEIEKLLKELDTVPQALINEIDTFHIIADKTSFEKYEKKIMYYSNSLFENAEMMYNDLNGRDDKETQVINKYYLIAAAVKTVLQYGIKTINFIDDNKQKPVIKELLTNAHKENGGRLTSIQLKELAETFGLKSLKYLQNRYSEILPDLK